MSNFICWICEINKAYKEYEDVELLNEEGDKPCFDCIVESEKNKEETEEEIEL